MLQRGLNALKANRLLHQNQYYLLSHQDVDKMKKKIYQNQDKRSLRLKLKFLWRQLKYTFIQGLKDCYADSRWLYTLYNQKDSKHFTGYEKAKSSRIVLDILKFVPYSLMIAIPLADFFIPVYIWMLPNATPSFFQFDTAQDEKIQNLENKQEHAYNQLIDKLLDVLRQLSKHEEEFVHYEFFKKDFFEVMDELNSSLHFQSFSSDQLIKVLQFLGGEYITGTASVNKLVGLFLITIPRFSLKIGRLLLQKILGRQIEPYQEWFGESQFRILQFNYFPFEFFKRKFLIYQINRKYRIMKEQDEALYQYGTEDIIGYDIKEFARERGLAGLTCYMTLKNVVENDWVMTTTHPKFTNNTKLWYAVMMYHFLKETNKDLN